MHYVKAFDRDQMMMTSWESMVEPQSTARLIDAFVNSLNIADLGIRDLATEGRPPYDPRSMLKLYVYGCDNGIKSSRKLARNCKVNIEVKWMLGGVEPDFRTISDFRKNNVDCLKKVFTEFNKRIAGAVDWGFTSIDGSKFLANNSKDNNFTKNKLDDRIKWLNGHVEEYLRILEEADDLEGPEEREELTKELIEKRLKEARERLEKYEGYQRVMEETGQSQMSITDADARLMKNKNGFAVAYNPQTAVDSNTHLIRDFQMTNQVTDHGLIHSTLTGMRKEDEGVMETVADKGYENNEDLIRCLEDGIIPHVITDDGKDGYLLEIPYEGGTADAQSTKPEEIRKALHAGIIPEAYKAVITDMEVRESRCMVSDEPAAETSRKGTYGTQEEMLARAREGYFVRDPERNLVYCPNGDILRQKCVKSNGNIRYSNKNACRHCHNRNKCYKGKNEWKEVDFSKDCLERPCRDWLKSDGKQAEKQCRMTTGKRHWETRKTVRFFLKPDRKKTAERMCLSEHPFGTIKRAMGFTYFLLRGIRNVTGEFALMCLGYNIKRAKSLLGYEKMMKLMEAKTC